MSSSTQADAERKFWQVPEMVEKLLENLDASGTLELAEVQIQLAHPILCFRDNKKSDMGPETTICVVGPSC